MSTDKQEIAAEECQRHQRTIIPASRIMFCGRCGHALGGPYSHYSSWCKAADKMLDDSHFCCPGSCEHRDGRKIDQAVPCHPSPGEYQRWALETDAARRQHSSKSHESEEQRREG